MTTERGEDEARELGARLRGVQFTRVLTSPRQRARRTCELAGLGSVSNVEPDLAEWDYGESVAVALLPPLVTFGLLRGGGHSTMAVGALSLLLVNLICMNLAGVLTFLVQGIHPASWWEENRARKATRVAIGLWVALLAGLVGIALLLRKG